MNRALLSVVGMGGAFKQLPKHAVQRRVLVIETAGFVLAIVGVWITEAFDPPFSLPQVLTLTVLLGILGSLSIRWTGQMISRIKYMEGFMVICAHCKSVRADGEWVRIETIVNQHSDGRLSHGLCPKCTTELYGLPAEAPSSTAGAETQPRRGNRTFERNWSVARREMDRVLKDLPPEAHTRLKDVTIELEQRPPRDLEARGVGADAFGFTDPANRRITIYLLNLHERFGRYPGEFRKEFRSALLREIKHFAGMDLPQEG